MDDVNDLVKWLREQLDDDERIARAATPGPWYRHDAYLDAGGHTATVLSGEPGKSDLRAWLPTRRGDVFWDKGRNVWNDAEYIAQHNPARTLAEVDAKRRILDWCEAALREFDRAGVSGPSTPLDFVALLALPYADREGFREEWKP